MLVYDTTIDASIVAGKLRNNIEQSYHYLMLHDFVTFIYLDDKFHNPPDLVLIVHFKGLYSL